MTRYGIFYDNLKQAPIVLAVFKYSPCSLLEQEPLVAPDYAFGPAGNTRLFQQREEASNLRM